MRSDRLPMMFDATVTPKDRAGFYNRAFSKYPGVLESHGWVCGTWMTGADYRGSGYHGSFPPGFLDRVMSMFPDATPSRTLQLFSGSLPPGPYVRVDLRGDHAGVVPDVRADAQVLPFGGSAFDLIIADPPSTAEDADHYGVPIVSRAAVFDECVRVLAPGGNLVWLDMIQPMYRSAELRMWATIGVVRSTNHRVRAVFMWARTAKPVGHMDLDAFVAWATGRGLSAALLARFAADWRYELAQGSWCRESTIDEWALSFEQWGFLSGLLERNGHDPSVSAFNWDDLVVRIVDEDEPGGGMPS